MRKELLDAGLLYFEDGAVDCINPDLPIDDQAELLPYDRKWEFPRDHIKLGGYTSHNFSELLENLMNSFLFLAQENNWAQVPLA